MRKLLAIILVLSMLAGISVMGVSADIAEDGYIVSPSEGDMEEILVSLGEGGTVAGYVGDADLSEDITIKDATAIQKHIAALEILTDVSLLLADADRSEDVTIKDATAIQKWVAKITISEPVYHTLYKKGEDVVVPPVIATLDEAVLGRWTEEADIADELNAKINIRVPAEIKKNKELMTLFSKNVDIDSFEATVEYTFSEDLAYTVEVTTEKTYEQVMLELTEDLTKFIFAVTGATSVKDKKFDVALNALGVETVEEFAQMLLALIDFNAVISDENGTFFASEGTFTFDETTEYSYEISGDTMTFKDAEGNVTNILKRVKILDTAVFGRWTEEVDIADELNAKIINPIDSRQDRTNYALFNKMVKIDSFEVTCEYLFNENLTYLRAYSGGSYLDALAELEEDLTQFIFASININSVEDRKFNLALRALGAESLEELAKKVLTQQDCNSVLIYKAGTFFASEGTFTLDETDYTYEITEHIMTFKDAEGNVTNTLRKNVPIDSAIIGQWSASVDLALKINNKIVSPVDDSNEKIKFKDYVSIDSYNATMVYTFNEDGTYSITYPKKATYLSVVTELEEDLTAFLLAATGATSTEDRKFVVFLNALGYESVTDFATALFTQAEFSEITAPSTGKYFAADGTIVLDEKVNAAYTISKNVLTITIDKGAFIILQKHIDLDIGK